MLFSLSVTGVKSFNCDSIVQLNHDRQIRLGFFLIPGGYIWKGNFTKLPEPFIMVFCITADADPNRREHHLYCLNSNVYIFSLLAIKAGKLRPFLV